MPCSTCEALMASTETTAEAGRYSGRQTYGEKQHTVHVGTKGSCMGWCGVEPGVCSAASQHNIH